MKKILLVCTLSSCSAHLYAADSDIRLRLSQELDQQQYWQEQRLLKDENIIKYQKLPSLNIQGKEYEIEHDNPSQLAQALYLSVMQKQWENVIVYLEHYKSTSAYDQALTEFAEAALARAQGNLAYAEQKFKHSLQLQPNNLVCELELARVLFEQQKNQQSLQLFKNIQQRLNQFDVTQIPAGILKTVGTFIQVLNQRDAWQGNVAFGSLYTMNLNNSAEYYSTLTFYGLDEKTGKSVPIYEVRQGSPDPIDTTGLDYEATLSKRWSLSGQHGMAFRGLFYGQWYGQQPDYNELTLNLNAGYSYQDQQNQVLLAPVLEHKWYGHDPLYNAYGIRGEWMRFISETVAAKIEAEVKDLNYSEYKDQDGLENSVFTTFWKVLPHQWTIFAGLDYIDHNTKEKYMAAYQQQGIRLGVSKNFEAGFNATLFSSYRWRQFDRFAPLLETRRHDFEQNYNVVFSAPKWQFYGLIPTLNYRYNRNHSNVDWLYSYDKQNISLKLEHRF